MSVPHPTIRLVKKPQQTDREREVELERHALQKLANGVRDEEHWKEILGQAVTPASREELERVIGPLLKFRRAAVCTTPDCESGEIGMWRPVIEIRSALDSESVTWAPIELEMCDTCKNDAALKDLLTTSIWEQILEQWPEGEQKPTHRLTRLTWERCH